MYEQIRITELLDLNHTIAKELFEKKSYPWEVLTEIDDFIMKIGPTLPKEEYNQIGENIWVAKNAKIFSSAYLNGPLIIGKNTEVRHCAFIRGSAIVGDNAVVGNSTELKGSILFDNVQVPHYNYIGDSVMGYKAHTGAGTITSNLKSDKTVVTISINGEILSTERKKLGAIVGDNVEVGCNSVLNPGTVIGRNSNVYPLSMVRGYVSPFSIYKDSNQIVQKL